MIDSNSLLGQNSEVAKSTNSAIAATPVCTYFAFLCFDQHVPCTDEDASFVAASGPSRLLFLKDLVIIISWEGESVGSVDSCGYNDSDAELLA